MTISDIRVEDFIMSLSNEDNDILSLKKVAENTGVPIIRDETKDFLRTILKLTKPKKILEIGTAIAYSTLIMHKLLPDSEITTIEDFPKRIINARKNIDKFENKEKITLIEKDAGVYLKENISNEVFDFVFLDAAKAQYIVWLPDIKRLMKKGGVLVADNIFKDGEILESKFLINKRDRTIHKRMRDYLYTIMHDKDMDSQIFNIGDGLSISVLNF